jgi:uncharacterized protein
MKIKISNLSDGVHNFNFEEAVKDININEPFFGNILVEAELNKSHSQLVLSAKISAKANFDCDRCNNSFDAAITNSYKMVYMIGMAPEESESINIAYLPPDADKIVLDIDVRDYALLAVPMKKLCNEDCKGLCPKCGKNLNEGDCSCDHINFDDRWLPLMKLKSKLNNN